MGFGLHQFIEVGETWVIGLDFRSIGFFLRAPAEFWGQFRHFFKSDAIFKNASHALA
jgi:hypothetical protein